MADGSNRIRHYAQLGTQCGKMCGLVRASDLNILDCIWVSYESLNGYPPKTTCRVNTLLVGFDPVTLDYYASRHILLPIGGRWAQEHNPDYFHGLEDHLLGARDTINARGGIKDKLTQVGDVNIEVVFISAGGNNMAGSMAGSCGGAVGGGDSGGG